MTAPPKRLGLEQCKLLNSQITHTNDNIHTKVSILLSIFPSSRVELC